MKMRIVLKVVLALAGVAVMAGETTFKVLPEAQKVSGEWQTFQVNASSLMVENSDASSEALVLAEELLRNKVAQLPRSGEEGNVTILLGVLDSPKFAGLLEPETVPELPESGYIIRVLPQDDGSIKIVAAGVDERGAYYAAATLAQLIGTVDGSGMIKVADIEDYPYWQKRYFGCDFGNKSEYLEKLAQNKISGFALQWRKNFDQVKPDVAHGKRTVGEYLADIKEVQKTGLVDFMVLYGPYANANNSKEPFNIAKKEDMQTLIDSCRLFAENGIYDIMILFDDRTPFRNGEYTFFNADEAKVFDNSIGKAHGWAMKELYNALHEEFPQVRFSMCPAPYSRYRHDIASPKVAKYLVDWAEEAPDEVALVWTGPEVVSSQIGKEDYQAFKELIGEHEMIIFDNSNCIDAPLAIFESDFYDGCMEDSLSTIFMNCRLFIWPWNDPYILGANAYLWNPAAYQAMAADFDAWSKLYNQECAELIHKFRPHLLKLQRGIVSGDKSNLATELEAADKLLVELETVAPKRIVERLRSEIQPAREMLEIPTLEVSVPEIKEGDIVLDGKLDEELWKQAPVLELTSRKGDKVKMPTTVKVFRRGEEIYLGYEGEIFENYQGTVIAEHDGEIYTQKDVFEIFVRPSANGSYVHYAFDPEAHYADERNKEGGDSFNPDWTIKTWRSGKNFSAEVRISGLALEAIQGVPLAPGVAWRVNLHRANGYAKEVLSWSQGGNGFHYPQFFGTFRFE